MKQTTLNFNRRSKRPRADDSQDTDQSTRRTTTLSLGQSLPPSSSRTSQDQASWSRFSQTHAEIQSTDAPSNPEIPLQKTTSLSFKSYQLPSSSSSQRIVRDGERMVTNSEEDDDSSSLEDLDSLIRLQTHENSREALEQVEEVPRERSGCPQSSSGRPQAAHNPPLAAKVAEYKYSLALLAEQRKHLQTSGEDVAKVTALLEARRHAQPVTGHKASENGHPNENVIDAVMNDRGAEEDADRLKDVLRRTEALHRDKVWSFFHANVEAQIAVSSDFPDLENSQLRPILYNRSSRQQAFLNGFVEDYATKIDLPDELVLWIIESTCLEKQENLRLSYVHVLKELGLRKGEILSPQRIDKLFQKIGASEEALEMRETISPGSTVSKGTESFLQDHLIPILGLIHALAGTLRPDSSIHAICTLCRLLLDHIVVDNCSIVTAIDETLNSLIESIPDLLYEQVLQDILPTVYGSVDDPVLRLQLVQNLPVYTCRTAIFRRRLALAFFFQDTGYFEKPNEDPTVDLTAIAKYIQTPRFAISKKTDYAQLTASMAMLDIGIDTGEPVPSFSTSNGESNFDSAVDLLSRHLKELSTQIVGTSALNMRRTEAKEILDAIQRRLSYTVRSRPPPKKSILVDPAAGHQAEKKRMTDYLDHTKLEAFDGSLVDVTDTNNKQISMHE